MSREQFEEELRSRMQDYKPSVDTQKLWNNIKNEKSKNYTGVIAFFLLLMGTGIGALLLTQNQNKAISDNSNKEIVSATEISTENNYSNEYQKTTPKVSATINENVLALNEFFQSTSEEIDAHDANSAMKHPKAAKYSSIQNDKAPVKTSNEKSKFSRKFNLNSNTNTNSSIASAELGNTISSAAKKNEQFAVSQNTIRTGDFNKINEHPLRKNDVAQITTSNTEENNDVSTRNTEILKSNDFNQIKETVQNGSHENYIAQNFYKDQEINSLAQINSTEFESYLLNERVGDSKILDWEKMDGIAKKRKSSNSKGQRYKSSRKTFEISLEALIGPMFPFRKLSEKNASEGDYLNQRAFTEKVLRGFKAEVNTYGAFKKYGYFKVGVDYAGFKESFIYEGETTNEYWDPNGISSIQINGEGDTTYVADSVLVTQVIDRNVNSVNSYNILDLSVALGFVLDKDKWSIFIDGGIAYNIMFKARGQYLNQDLEVAYFSDEQVTGGQLLRNNLGPAVVGSFGFAYKINKQLDFKIRSGYKRYFNDFSSNENPLSQKYNFINLGLGIQYTFNNF